jgi:translation initiation factor IF-3
MDYNRFKYETAQRAKESRKKATNTSIKEMKYRPKIGTGDFLTKTRQVSRFLEDGHKVKVTIMFRGREVSHPDLGMKILEDLAEQVSAVAKVEAAPKLDGRNMTMVLAPDRRAKPVVRRSAGADGSHTAGDDSAPETSGADELSLSALGPDGDDVDGTDDGGDERPDGAGVAAAAATATVPPRAAAAPSGTARPEDAPPAPPAPSRPAASPAPAPSPVAAAPR